jgi:proteasome lid subunit RPN8/RPN11
LSKGCNGERSSIEIRRAVVAGVIEHAKREAPLECCGLLLGADGLIEAFIPARNLRNSATAYLIDPADHFAARRGARAEGRAILGAYHSHPRSAAVPSATDLAEAHDAELLYVIVSLRDEPPDIRAYRLQGGTFVDVAFATIPQEARSTR